MSFDFDYKKPDELNPFRLISEGDGFFKIMQVEEKVSKSSGNPMLVLTHKLQNDKNETTLWMQYILKNEYAADNLYRICDAAGKVDLYTASNGKLDPAALLGMKGRCKIKTESDATYGDKSKIGKFIPYRTPEAEAAPAAFTELVDDSIPF